MSNRRFLSSIIAAGSILVSTSLAHASEHDHGPKFARNLTWNPLVNGEPNGAPLTPDVLSTKFKTDSPVKVQLLVVANTYRDVAGTDGNGPRKMKVTASCTFDAGTKCVSVGGHPQRVTCPSVSDLEIASSVMASHATAGQHQYGPHVLNAQLQVPGAAECTLSIHWVNDAMYKTHHRPGWKMSATGYFLIPSNAQNPICDSDYDGSFANNDRESCPTN